MMRDPVMLSDIDQSMASITCVVDFFKPSITSGEYK
jgi:hypothetical protein